MCTHLTLTYVLMKGLVHTADGSELTLENGDTVRCKVEGGWA